MAEKLFQFDIQPSPYFDRRSNLSEAEYFEALRRSATLYVGNLSINTKEESIYELFGQIGDLKLFKIGVTHDKKPAGFCFIEYHTREEAQKAVACLSGQILEGRPIRVDWDYGFRPGREFGRGEGGMQIRDCVRKDAEKGRHQSKRPQLKEAGAFRGRDINGGQRNFNSRVRNSVWVFTGDWNRVYFGKRMRDLGKRALEKIRPSRVEMP